MYLVGFTPGVELVSTTMKVIEGRQYRPAVREVTVSDPIRRMYKNMDIGDKLVLNNTEWTIVGVFAGSDSIGDSVLRADAATVMSAFNRTTYQAANVQLESVAAFQPFKDSLTSNPAIAVEVRTVAQTMKSNFGQLNSLLDFVAYFVGTVMATGAIFGALNRSVRVGRCAAAGACERLRAIGFNNGPIVLSVLLEGAGCSPALPGAFPPGALVAWVLFSTSATIVSMSRG